MWSRMPCSRAQEPSGSGVSPRVLGIEAALFYLEVFANSSLQASSCSTLMAPSRP